MPRATDRPIADQDRLGPAAGFQAALIAVCALLSVVPPRHISALYVLLALAVGDLIAYRRSAHPLLWPWLSAVVAGAAVASTGEGRSPLLPYLLAPALAVGLLCRVGPVVVTCGLTAGALLLGGLQADELSNDTYVQAAAEWTVLALAVGLVATWATQLSTQTATAGKGDRFAEVHALLEQLHSATRGLPGGLDAPTVAEGLLDRCHEIVVHGRSAVLVQPAEAALVPLAVRGAKRVPWRAPLSEPGPLRTAWEGKVAVLDVRKADKAGRRRGSSLAVLPLLSSDRPFGLVIVEVLEPATLERSLLGRLQEVTDAAALQLETALLFEEVRSSATAQERDRLAREMHDGVAQELAFVGYQLDDLRLRAAKVDPGLAEQVQAVRTDMTRLISDIRLSITDLKTTMRPDRGLGAALSTYARAVCAGKDVVLHLSLKESPFRLPSEQEVALFTLAQAVTQEVRRSPDVRNLWVDLQVDPPSAELRLEHDGPLELTGGSAAATLQAQEGWSVTTSQGRHGGPRVVAVLEGGGVDGSARAAG